MASFTGLGSPTKALRLITSQTGGRTSHPKEKGEKLIRQTLQRNINKQAPFWRALEP